VWIASLQNEDILWRTPQMVLNCCSVQIAQWNVDTSELQTLFAGPKKWTTIKMINRSLLSPMEKLLVPHIESLLWSRWGSNPVRSGLRVMRFYQLSYHALQECLNISQVSQYYTELEGPNPWCHARPIWWKLIQFKALDFFWQLLV
jgi:hypothetical protein